jgi:hypothetical protein
VKGGAGDDVTWWEFKSFECLELSIMDLVGIGKRRKKKKKVSGLHKTYMDLINLLKGFEPKTLAFHF